MKITKSQLRRIIKEEKAQHHAQAPPVRASRQAEAVDQIETNLNELFDDGVDNAGLISLLEGIIRDIGLGFVGQPT